MESSLCRFSIPYCLYRFFARGSGCKNRVYIWVLSIWANPWLVTWVTTIYTTRQVAEMVSKEPFLTSTLAALMMVFLDFFIEPFAIRHQLWTWNSIEVPLHNYIGWFVSGLIIQYCFIKSVKFSVNKLSLPVYLIQLAFFIALFLLKK